MNKEIFDGLPNNERTVAEKIISVSENMHVPQNFQLDLESQLMDAYQKKSQPDKSWFARIVAPVSWALIAVIGFIILNWTIRSLVPPEQTNIGAPNTEVPFETQVGQGNICTDPLALGHGFAVFLSNQDKTGFIQLDQEKSIDELRTFSWTKNGEQLAILGNSIGGGNVYLATSSGEALQPVLANSELGYLYDFAASRDGKQFAVWSAQNNTVLYIIYADRSDVTEISLDIQLLGKPQFTNDNKSIIVRGADTSTSGLFEVMLDGSQPSRLISKLMEDEGGFALSPDGTHLAYLDMDRDSGGVVLMVQDLKTQAVRPLPGDLSIPKGSGSSIPDVANLSWSQDGTKLTFDFGRNATDRAIYLAYVDGSGIVKVVDSAHAPTISSDGNCLAYIRDKQVFVLDLNNVSLASNSATPVLLADLPTGKGTADFRLDKLQWSP